MIDYGFDECGNYYADILDWHDEKHHNEIQEQIAAENFGYTL